VPLGAALTGHAQAYPRHGVAASLGDLVVARFTKVQALAQVMAAAKLVIQLGRQHPLGVLVGAVDQIHRLALEVAGIVSRQVRHAVDVHEVGGGDEPLELVHSLVAPFGVDIEQV